MPRGVANQLKQAEGEGLVEFFDIESNVHRSHVPKATKPVALATTLDPEPIKAQHMNKELNGIGLFQRSARNAAKQRAVEAASSDYRARVRKAEEARDRAQAALDKDWALLRKNDERSVRKALAAAFSDASDQVTVETVEGSTVAISIEAIPFERLPDIEPYTTAAGNPGLRKMTLTTSHSHYKRILASPLLLAVKKAFAAGPRLESVAVTVYQRRGSGSKTWSETRSHQGSLREDRLFFHW